MTFNAILAGLLLFAVGFALHVAWWRLSRPHDDIRGLAICFALFPAGLAILGNFETSVLASREWLAAYLATLMVSATYIMYYPAAQAASPTMLLVLEIARAGKSGTTRQSIRNAFDSELLCRQGINNLVHEKFAAEVGGKLSIAPRGAVLLQMLNNWRKILGLKYGSG
jgi:hypothetical protein